MNTKYYSFDGEEKDISPSTQGLQYPSYLLIDSNGVVQRIFAGTSEIDQVRMAMADEIIDDVLIVKNGS